MKKILLGFLKHHFGSFAGFCIVAIVGMFGGIGCLIVIHTQEPYVNPARYEPGTNWLTVIDTQFVATETTGDTLGKKIIVGKFSNTDRKILVVDRDHKDHKFVFALISGDEFGMYVDHEASPPINYSGEGLRFIPKGSKPPLLPE